MQLIKQFLLFFISTSLCCFAQRSFAARSYGRIIVGGYTAKEAFLSDEFGSDSNDEMVISSRLYYKVFDIGTDKWELVSDLRDKHDFFDKLDREKLELRDKNEFQLRQLNARWTNPNGQMSMSLGRFPVQDVGAIYTDGLLAEFRWTPSLWSTVFGGKNPQSESHSYLQYSQQANVGGIGLTYQSRQKDWSRNFYLTNGLVAQTYENETDRAYFYHQMNYQWAEDSRIFSLMYLDFVPRSYVQNASLIWQQEYFKGLSSQLGALMMDSIEYYRRQGVRETLPPSPYREAHLRLAFGSERRSLFSINALAGSRDYDQKTKNELSLGYLKARIFTRNWDIYCKLGTRNNFDSKDLFVKTGLDYFSRKWEFNFDVEYAAENYTNGTSLHPLIVEASLSNMLSRSFFWTGSLQRASDESVTILTSFLKLGYRFGDQEVPPIRDGVPPRGPI